MMAMRSRWEHRLRSLRSTGSTAARLALLLGLAVAATVLAYQPAHAADEDQIDSFTAEYVIEPSGTITVTETRVWRFGASSARHGISRDFVTREAWDGEHDAVYGYTGIAVSSPDPGVYTDTSTTSTRRDRGRGESLRIRIGNPDYTVSADTATYVIRYRLSGALRSEQDTDQLYWNVTGTSNPAIKEAAVTVQAPGGVTQAICFAGPFGSTDQCGTAEVTDGVATFEAVDLLPGEGLTIGAGIADGAAVKNTPTLVERGDRLHNGTRNGYFASGGLAALSALVSPLLGRRWWKKHGGDDRYLGVPPGSVPSEESRTTAPVGPSDPHLVIPVAFSPPAMNVAQAGLLADGKLSAVETTATIVDLAARGVLRIDARSAARLSATLLDPTGATERHETGLLLNIFGGRPSGAVATLSGIGVLTRANDNLQQSVRTEMDTSGLFKRNPSQGSEFSARFLVGGVIFFGFLGIMGSLLLAGPTLALTVALALLALVPVLATVLVVRSKLKVGARSARGRALTDQIEGFRTYLATAEASQLRFEEDQDIFSRYLPWAIIFDLTHRWTTICQELVAAGRIPDVEPSWFHGSVPWSSFDYSHMSGMLTGASQPLPVARSSMSSGRSGRSGGGSSFSGGSSGGGGGGGGSSSW